MLAEQIYWYGGIAGEIAYLKKLVKAISENNWIVKSRLTYPINKQSEVYVKFYSSSANWYR